MCNLSIILSAMVSILPLISYKKCFIKKALGDIALSRDKIKLSDHIHYVVVFFYLYTKKISGDYSQLFTIHLRINSQQTSHKEHDRLSPYLLQNCLLFAFSMFTFPHLQTCGFTIKLGPDSGRFVPPTVHRHQDKHFNQ